MVDPQAQRGVVFIFSEAVKENSKIIDVIRQHGNFYVHKQIEIKNGLLYVRLKKRSLSPPVHA